MKYDWIDDYLMNKVGVTKDLKIEWNWIRYKIGEKMFVAICLDSSNNEKYITLKLNPDESELLRKLYKDIIPGYYMNKIHWNSINPNGNVPDDVLKDMLDKSYNLVINSFSKKKQSELLGN
ncbi:MAG: MmcQ/YjbR family DNA-binding protein [Acetobacter sp.]|nr:MmcQ/YjbR family DNA-binding protein [Bacteroides sp.]MCM1340166.1 MmcQ/YjbR family DNA-binding protein [Acetobacter sp.]MCM1432882.1 MmcQ/YjbR family DNA-binding protein [Clostridiales bacterium]